MDARIEQHLKALDSFKDWSNYMVVTTVAALGWVASKDSIALQPFAMKLVVACLGLSIVFGIFTLALIPIVAEAVTVETQSIYGVDATFNLIYLWRPQRTLRLKSVCWPQHALFLLGIIIYSFARILS